MNRGAGVLPLAVGVLVLTCTASATAARTDEAARAADGAIAPLTIPAAPIAQSRQAATDLVYGTVLPASRTTSGWTGSVAGCSAGVTSTIAQAQGLASVNAFRALGGLAPVVFDSALSAKAQVGALMLEANSALAHVPQPGWRCVTADGTEALGQSNLVQAGASNPSSLEYMDDQGERNISVGHRRWVLNPHAGAMGLGLTQTRGALWVISPSAGATYPDWVPWPTAGYFPVALEPFGRWSLSASSDTDLSRATVSVASPSGPLRVQVHEPSSGYGPDTISFEVDLPDLSALEADLPVSVSVAGMVRAGEVLPPVARTTTLTTGPRIVSTAPPTILGILASGELLSAAPGRWSVSHVDLTYCWLRDGLIVARQSSYRLTEKDEGHAIGLKLSASSSETLLGHPLWSSSSATVASAGRVLSGKLRALIRPKVALRARTSRLVVSRGKWNFADITQRYRWSRDGERIRGERGRTLKLRERDRGHRFSVMVLTTSPRHGKVRLNVRAPRA